jgi:serine/threonine protein kinase
MSTDHGPTLQPGQRLGHALVIERLIGRGGMGAVYAAHDELLDRRVAVKVLARGADLEQHALSTLREARAAARVVHPHVVAIHGVGDHDGFAYIEMEWVAGVSLRQRLAATGQGRRVDQTQAGVWLAELAAALQAAHDADVVHCDVKPENVLVRAAGGCKLVDFGLARSRADHTHDRALSHGTQAYLAPELAHGPPTPAADQFSLAVLAVELLCGERPARSSWQEPPQLGARRDLPLPAQQALQRALAARPERRHESVTLFVDALLRGLGLPHVRSALVGALPVGDGLSASALSNSALSNSALAPRPVPDILANRSQDDHILACLAVLPSGYPGALGEMLGRAPDSARLQLWRDEGLVDGLGDDWRFSDPAERERVLAQLGYRERRALCAKAALAVEACGAQREPVREDASRLWMAARRPAEAARLALASAAASHDARGRDLHLARAAALLASPLQPLPWAEALLVRAEWALRCGWLAQARGPLAEVQGVLAEVALDDSLDLRLRALIASAEERARGGDRRAGLILLRQAEAWRTRASAWLGVVVDAQQATLAAQAGAGAEAVQRAEAGMARWSKDLANDDRAQAARGQLHLACGTGLRQLGQWQAARVQLRRAVALHAERGDTLATAAAEVALADLELARGARDEAGRGYETAAALVAPLGEVELAFIVDAHLGGLLLADGHPFGALRRLWRAQTHFAAHGLLQQELGVLELLQTACAAVRDGDGGREVARRSMWVRARLTG